MECTRNFNKNMIFSIFILYINMKFDIVGEQNLDPCGGLGTTFHQQYVRGEEIIGKPRN